MNQAGPSKEKQKYAFEQFTAIRRIWGLDFSPDSKRVIYAINTSGQFNLWCQSIDGGWPKQLTFFEDETVRSVGWSPKGDLLIFSADRHGNEFHQLYAISAQGGWPQQLTDRPQVQHIFSAGGWAPDGKKITYACNERTPTDMDVMLKDLKTGKTEMLLGGDANYFPVRWSPNGRYLSIVHYKSNTDTDIILFDTKDGSHKNVTTHEGEIVYFPGPWMPDSKGFYVVTDQGREFTALAFYELKSQKLSFVETPSWDIEHIDLSSDGKYLAYVVNKEGISRLYVKDLKTKKLLKLPKLPKGAIWSPWGGSFMLSPNGRYLAFYLETARRPLELYALDLKKKKLSRLTDNLLGGVAERDFVQPQLVRFSTFDGRLIPAWLYKPKGLKRGERCPVVLSIHGGPESQERPQYRYAGLYQYLLNRGIAVLAPNIRGSTGYGKSYQRLIHRDWGGGELKDLEHAAKFLQSLDWVDSKRIGVFGGSFGGFATLSCVTRLADYWAAAVDLFGPSNLVTFARSVPPFWKRFMKKWVGDPDEDKEMLNERSPITYVDNIRCPILIIQGANDPRVVKAESDQMVERIRSKGGIVEYMVFEDEGHGFTKRKSELKAWKASAEFLEKHLCHDN